MAEILQSFLLLLCHRLSYRTQVGALGQVPTFMTNICLSYENLSKELGFERSSWEQGDVSFKEPGQRGVLRGHTVVLHPVRTSPQDAHGLTTI